MVPCLSQLRVFCSTLTMSAVTNAIYTVKNSHLFRSLPALPVLFYHSFLSIINQFSFLLDRTPVGQLFPVWRRSPIEHPFFNLENICYFPSSSGGPISHLHSFTSRQSFGNRGGGGGEESHMKRQEMLVGKFEFNS